MGGSFRFWGLVLGIAAGAFAALWHPSARWVEHGYANGGYPEWQHIAQSLSGPVPWSLGDFAGLLGIGLVLWRAIVALRRRRKPGWRRAAIALIEIAAIAGAYALWFEAAWGWNYDRAPIETRLAFNAANVNAAAVNRLRSRAIEEMNALAPAAHAHSGEVLDIPALRAAWLPLVRRAGDRWNPHVGRPKPTIADPFMDATGTSGFINPFTLNVQIASDLLWFERPFSLAHEWTHVAAYAREDEANYVAILTCLRSRDPVLQYSGWLELFLYLPPLPHYSHATFGPLVWQDFAALRARNARRINLSLARLSWRTYNVYLKSNHVAAGVANYNEVTKLILGIPLDARGLPLRVHDSIMRR
ncbi:MAG: DUF3810 family protein [Vulcanimicrobiaceae bacterium]